MAQRLVDSWVGQFCARAGELLEDQGKFVSAAAFYERCCALTRGGRFGAAAEAEALSNLGYALKRGGRHVEALERYDASLAVLETTTTLGNRDKLLREMRHWVGSGEEHAFDETCSGDAALGRRLKVFKYRATCDRLREWSLAHAERLHARTHPCCSSWGVEVSACVSACVLACVRAADDPPSLAGRR